jgi:glycine hydroxymethyltransferase
VVWKAVHYGVNPATGRIDYDVLRERVKAERPKLLIAGGSAYARIIDFAAFRSIADEVDAVFLVDMAHFAGLVAGGVHPSPVPHAPIVTSTTHKTLRGPRAGLILSTAELAKAVDKSVFPGTQGGPLEHVIAAKAVAFGEALTDEFKAYSRRVVDNAQTLASALIDRGFAIVSGGTDTHLMLVDLRPKRLTGKVAEVALGRAHITCNKNGIPFDPEKPTITSGLRLGTPAGTTRGFGVAEFRQIGDMIVEVLDVLSQKGVAEDSLIETAVRDKVTALVRRFPIYQS